MKRTNQWLQESYRLFNDVYFGGNLPCNAAVVYGVPNKKHDAHFDPRNMSIVVWEGLKDHDGLALLCLLHEMAHFKLEMGGHRGGTTIKDKNHGMIFQSEIVRLFNIGAYDGLL